MSVWTVPGAGLGIALGVDWRALAGVAAPAAARCGGRVWAGG
jgi:hypothetical protein